MELHEDDLNLVVNFQRMSKEKKEADNSVPQDISTKTFPNDGRNFFLCADSNDQSQNVSEFDQLE